MLKDKSDEFYGARLVADARLHLGAIVNNESSEAFFVTMCKIIKNEFYLGYKTFTGKEIKLAGMKDFIFNSHYGLGVKRETMPTFLANCAKAATKDRTQAQCAARFVKWLGEQHDKYDLPHEYLEFRRIDAYINGKYKRDKREKWRRINILRRLYHQYPELLQEIGAERKYKDVTDCAQDLGFWEKKERLKPLALYKHPTILQVEDLAKALSKRLDRKKRRVLIAKLIEIYKEEPSANDSEFDHNA
jgi:hypothetical protein